jgi:hypothetical protein
VSKHASYAFDVSDYRELAVFYNYIFVGCVENGEVIPYLNIVLKSIIMGR